ncbi:MAG: DUF4331 domain-containing protein [Planctomycetota bacterium]
MKKLTRIVGSLALGASAFTGLSFNAQETQASSHREAPGITEDPTVDCTDVYAFVSPDAPTTTTLIANYIPLEEPSGGPNYFKFSDTALYEIHVDNTGDAKEDITFRFEFTTTTKADGTFLYNTGPITVGANDYTNLNVVQRYKLTRVDGDRRTGTQTVLADNLLVAPNNVGPKSIADYPALANAATYSLAGGIKVFCGQRDDPFFINLGRAFDLLNVDAVLPGGLDSQAGLAPDHLAGFNTHSIAIQVPNQILTNTPTPVTDSKDERAIIGVWSTASRRQVRLNRTKGKTAVEGGAWVQVSRLGMPLVNELVIPRSNKDVFNNSEPQDDTQFLSFVQNSEVAGILNSLFGVGVPANPRNDLVTAFLTGVDGLNKRGTACEYQRLNTAIAPTPVASRNRLGVLGGDLDGFPNGRRLEDDVVDIALRVVAGSLNPTFNVSPNNVLGDTVVKNDKPFLTTFPYVALPHDGVTRVHQN